MRDDVLQVEVESVTKRFPRGSSTAHASLHAAVDDITLAVKAGEILALLGPSGCGKTTTLRLVAGFERVDTGHIALAGRTVETAQVHVPPEKRRVGMVFQDYALFPHLDVAGNIGFGLERRARDERVGALAELVGLTGLERRRPRELSGGQQQRVALARALAPDPDVILLDEPFSNLDSTLRQRVRADVQQILRAAEATAIFVTHSQDEALSIADRVAVMREGRVVQVGTPENLYEKPVDPFVASFIAEATLVEGVVEDTVVKTPFGVTHLRGQVAEGDVIVALRPEAVRVAHDEGSDLVVVDREFYGHDEVVSIRAGAVSDDGSTPVLRARLGVDRTITPGARVSVEFEVDPEDVFAREG
ncbi:MAG: ABC transporter ATP-binding protein [Acidimicrobiia bacterium]|nr:ABC transporter ATP-binding protein [Acidimicrobiia bacterium]